MSYWAQQAAREHDSDPPTRAERVPTRLTSAAESALIARDFPDANGEVAETLHGHVQELAKRRAFYACDELSWAPQEGDVSASLGEGEEEYPEGVPLLPGTTVIVRWMLRNRGTVEWNNRLLLYIE